MFTLALKIVCCGFIFVLLPLFVVATLDER
jgi:hypothetical protein